MKLKIKNIGIIKNAEILFDGLTVIAGKNDSGKSTVGKTLYSLIKSLSHIDITPKSVFNDCITDIFKSQISDDGAIEFIYDNHTFDITIHNNRCEKFDRPANYIDNDLGNYSPILVETPFIWSIFSTLKTINNLEARGTEIDFDVSLFVKDLHFVLSQKIKMKKSTIKLDIQNIIGGKFVENSLGSFVFKKDEKDIELINTAMGIKYFGILQVLSENNHFYKNQILILDEPEVHLHPSWQLKLAEIIVTLVKNGMKILVNSHSPYMIEALQRYAKKATIPNNFYLAEDREIIQDDESLSKIFEKLSEPFREFDKMDSEILNG